MAGTLYLVGTPIGNLEDMSPRAVKALREAAVIAAEDTRRTMILCNHFGIHTTLVSYHRHNERARAGELLVRLAGGDSVALATDAGLPGISDPGEILVRRAVESGFSVVPIPGPSACLLALAASGLPSSAFTFYGFLPRRAAARRVTLSRLAEARDTAVIYEAPRRLGETLAELSEVLGAGRGVVVARELTKIHEEFWRGTLGQAAAHYAGVEVKGEVTLVVAGRGESAEKKGDLAAARECVESMLKEGAGLAEAVRAAAHTCGVSRNALYRACLSDPRARTSCP
ncbi:MAG: 16S rRNA (cytidine(1402)-2'-O)-methyltransferase [Patescibacteria group bacterium]